MKATAFFDGGCSQMKGIAGCGAVIYDSNTNEILAVGSFLVGKTVNEAEYSGLILALRESFKLGITDLTIYGDSELVVRQVNGRYNARKDHLRKLRDEVWRLGKSFQSVKILETPRGKKNKRRDNNARADEIASICMENLSDYVYTPDPC